MDLENMKKNSLLPLYTIDSFSSKPFSGNPAAVCLDNDLDDATMQKIAAEMNISETAFVTTRGGTIKSFKEENEFGLRWFTPTNEVTLCGHATLASAAVLLNVIGNASDSITFNTLSGKLLARKSGDMITLDLPTNPAQSIDRNEIEDLLKVVCGGYDIQDVTCTQPGFPGLLVRLADTYTRQEFENIKPQIDQFMSADKTGKIKGVILTLKGSAQNGCVDENGRVYDFVSRYFSPWNGIPEDPVTGAAHTVLGPYWSNQLDKTEMYTRQCSKRGGELQLRMRADGRLDVSGYATPVLQGSIRYK